MALLFALATLLAWNSTLFNNLSMNRNTDWEPGLITWTLLVNFLLLLKKTTKKQSGSQSGEISQRDHSKDKTCQLLDLAKLSSVLELTDFLLDIYLHVG